MVMASVRGMGVAVITNTWGGFSLFPQSLARCATPKRCCSSMTAMPKRRNCTLSSSTAWVPTRMLTSPERRASSTSLRRLPLTMPVSSSTLTGRLPRKPRSVCKCCSASISVGAIRQAWYPLSMAKSIAMRATRVLPEPTSPCSSRFICSPDTKSARISCITRFWALVSGKGRWLK